MNEERELPRSPRTKKAMSAKQELEKTIENLERIEHELERLQHEGEEREKAIRRQRSIPTMLSPEPTTEGTPLPGMG